MSGVSIPQGMQGMWGGTGAPAGMGGGGAAGGGTIQAVNDPASTTGGLKAYDPHTMAGTTAAPVDTTPEKFAAVGMDASGMPSYVKNWLDQGGQGAMPTQSNTNINPLTGANAAGIGAGGTAIKGGPAYMGDDDAAWNKAHAKEIAAQAAKNAAAKAGAKPGATTTDPMTGLTLIPMNAQGGYNSPGLQQPMAVSDQWNSFQGGSNQIASPALGSSNAPQLMSKGIFTDNKGNYFSKDASGKVVPLTGTGPGGADYVKKFFQGWGYA
jgi:hypothetical protein